MSTTGDGAQLTPLPPGPRGTCCGKGNAAVAADMARTDATNAAIALGFASAAAAAAQLATGANIRRAGRRGIADDALVTSYAGAYSAAVTWLAWRASRPALVSTVKIISSLRRAHANICG